MPRTPDQPSSEPASRKTRSPTVSVITTVYNGERFLRECVTSVLDQTYRDWELIVLDDGSSDDTPRILAGIEHPKVEIISRERLGRAKALNTAIAHAAGEFIAILDADDIALPRRLVHQVEFLRAHPAVGVVGSAVREIIDERSGPVRVEESGILTDSDIRIALRDGNPLFHSSVVYRRQLFDLVGGYDERLPCELDRGLFLRMAPHCQFANLDIAVARKREHSDQFFWSRKGVRGSPLRVAVARVVNQARVVRYLGAPLWSFFSPFIRILRSAIPGRGRGSTSNNSVHLS